MNLDAGGDRRWAETGYDFGSEPDDEPYAQVWSCHHSFKVYEMPSNDGINRGNLDRMECNRCFDQVRAQKIDHAAEGFLRKRRKLGSLVKDQAAKITKRKADDKIDRQAALECSHCRLLVCKRCRDKYIAETGS